MTYFTRSAATARTSTLPEPAYKDARIPETTALPLSTFPSSPGSKGPVKEYPPRKRGRKAASTVSNTTASQGSKRSRKNPTTERKEAIIELPHNLGKVRAAATGDQQVPPSDIVHTAKTSRVAVVEGPTATDTTRVKEEEDIHNPNFEANTKQKKKPRNPYGLTPGVSPFPEWPHPTPEECEEVNRLLSSVHGEIRAPAAIPPPSITVSGCGEVPSILDALLRTVLSGATTKGNSGKAFEGLVEMFGLADRGIGDGSVDWEKVRMASLEEVESAIKSGGLGAIKSKNIKLILDKVYEKNLQLREELIKARDGQSGSGELQSTEKYRVTALEEDLLSLNHLHCLSKDEAMLEFVKYPGVGVKTAACVILFCLQRPCFAVDTHVFRLSKWLGWIPQEKGVDEITAFRHLEVQVSEHLKYSLHQLFLEHGKTCPRCRAATGDNTDASCVIDHLVRERTGKRKGKDPFRQTQLSVKRETMESVVMTEEDPSSPEVAEKN